MCNYVAILSSEVECSTQWLAGLCQEHSWWLNAICEMSACPEQAEVN